MLLNFAPGLTLRFGMVMNTTTWIYDTRTSRNSGLFVAISEVATKLYSGLYLSSNDNSNTGGPAVSWWFIIPVLSRIESFDLIKQLRNFYFLISVGIVILVIFQ